jgi:hypothetical protein
MEKNFQVELKTIIEINHSLQQWDRMNQKILLPLQLSNKKSIKILTIRFFSMDTLLEFHAAHLFLLQDKLPLSQYTIKKCLKKRQLSMPMQLLRKRNHT